MKAPSLLIITALLLSACATTNKQSLADKEILRDARIKASQHFYPNITARDVFFAAEKVLNHIDKTDMEMEIRSNRLVASRYFTAFAILAATHGKQFYTIDTKEQNGGVLVTVNSDVLANGGMFPSMVTQSYMDKIETNGNHSTIFRTGDFRLFHKRLSYFLVGDQEWSSCKNFKKNVEGFEEQAFGMCELIGIEDLTPAQHVSQSNKLYSR
ncbi:MAG: hypothetical protein COB46_12405 [Rhodospirillaceae bacterium]|nr:MAG: hypothetical protein COB46_12405 [Rhodospirillaceae bacterium]